MKNRYPFYFALVAFVWLFSSQPLFTQDYASVEEAKGLAVGEKAPEFEAKDKDGLTYVLNDELINGPVVLNFYRGQWCPVCNRHLSNIQDSLKYIIRKEQR